MTADQSVVRLAFVGTGGIAKAHAAAVAALSGQVEIVAAADPSADALAAFTASTKAAGFSSAAAMLAAIAERRVNAHGIVLCTPPNVRAEVIEPALKAGLGVLVEKPLAGTADAARHLARLAAAHASVPVAIGYCHRFTPAMLEAKRLVAQGRIGRLTRFENVFAFHHPPMSGRWFSDPAVSGGGSFVDTGCHSLDLFHFLVGPPRVAGAVLDHGWRGRGDSSGSALVVAASGPHAGVAGSILSGWLEPARFLVRLTGTEGSLAYDYEKPTELLLTHGDGKQESIPVETHEVRFTKQMAAFAAALREKRSPEQVGLASITDGLLVAEAVDKAHEIGKLYN